MITRPLQKLACVLVVATATLAQSVKNAELIDEFGSLPCEFILARTDALAADLEKDPTSTAAIGIYRPKRQPTLAEMRRRLITSTLERRGLDSKRFSFFMAGPSPDGEIRTQFWMVPEKAISPTSTWWNPRSPDLSQRFLFGISEDPDVCPTFVPRQFAKLLMDNSGSRGLIRVFPGSYSLAEKFAFAEQWIDELVKKHGVPRKSLRRTFGTRRSDLMRAEFWFVPAQAKRPKRGVR